MRNFELASIGTGGNDATKSITLTGRDESMNAPSLDQGNVPQGTCAIIMQIGDPQKKTILGTGCYLV